MSRFLKIGGLTVLVLGVCLGAYWLGSRNSEPKSSSDASADYPLLAKRLFITNPSDTFVNFVDLRKQLNTYFTDNNIQGTLYFEYLPTGTSIRIDGDKPQVGASLLKVPAAMELYKAAELNKINLDQTITLRQDWLDSAYGELYKKGAGYQLTLREATKIMLEDSDNTALNAISYYTQNLLNDDQTPISALDLEITVDESSNYTIAIGSRDYSSVLKCLYFSCYLDKPHSQELLTYLSNTQYNNRLQAGISDKSITVAHKIGNYAQKVQSDCGIVYIPNRNYILCVMLQGTDTADTDKKISEISKKAYDFVVSQK